MDRRKINVVMVASECAPLAKVGGLADVVGSLPKAMHNTNVSICLPMYEHLQSMKTKLIGELSITDSQEVVKIYKTILPKSKVEIFLLYNKNYLSRGPIYLNPNKHSSDTNQGRYGFFCVATLEFIHKYKPQTQVIHCHDWHAGLIPLLIKSNKSLNHLHTVFTIHNIANQGIWPIKEAKKISKQLAISKIKEINFMETGIRYADQVTTVSPTYAKEILTKKYGYNLAPLLRKRSKNLSGILNGIDTDYFNPKTDNIIYKKFSIKKLISKTANKLRLQKELSLPINKNILLLGVISRLYEQKGLDWLVDIIPQLIKFDIQMVVLGTGDKILENQLKTLEKKFPKNIKALIKFDITWAQKIYASSDIFLIPSRFEPCGLTQMIAMRYGTVPIVRETGGLKDTVPIYKKIKGKINGVGFVFKQENSQALYKTIIKALKVYDNKKDWEILQKNCMRQDFSWRQSAQEYVKLYKKSTRN